MGRPKNTAQRRAQIVNGLLEVMSERGYEGASVVAIAEAAQLTPGLVHYHFETKQAILVALVARLAATVTQRYEQRRERAGDSAAAQLDAWIEAHLALGSDADRDAVAAWVFIGAESIRQPEVREVYERAVAQRIEQVQALLRAALVEAQRSTRRLAKLAALVVATVEGAYQLGIAVPEQLPRGFAAPTLERAVRAWIEAEPRIGSAKSRR